MNLLGVSVVMKRASGSHDEECGNENLCLRDMHHTGICWRSFFESRQLSHELSLKPWAALDIFPRATGFGRILDTTAGLPVDFGQGMTPIGDDARFGDIFTTLSISRILLWQTIIDDSFATFFTIKIPSIAQR